MISPSLSVAKFLKFPPKYQAHSYSVFMDMCNLFIQKFYSYNWINNIKFFDLRNVNSLAEYIKTFKKHGTPDCCHCYLKGHFQLCKDWIKLEWLL